MRPFAGFCAVPMTLSDQAEDGKTNPTGTRFTEAGTKGADETTPWAQRQAVRFMNRTLLRLVAGIGMAGAALLAGIPSTAQQAPRPRPDDLVPVALQALVPEDAPPAEEPDPERADAAATDPGVNVGPVTGFPMPRFVSLRATEANARRGPSASHRIDWVFTRSGMPLMIVAEYGNWRRVVDRDGAGGWMHYSLLSGERTAVIEVPALPLYSRPDRTSPIRAEASIGVVGHVAECDGTWCLMDVGGYRGWVDPGALWGVDPGEVFD